MENALRDDPKPANIASVLDFPGYYESCLARGIDSAEEMEAYNIQEDHPDLEERDIHEAIFAASEHAKAFAKVNARYVEWLGTLCEGTGIELCFESMKSPREYNFTTDRLFVTVNDPALLRRLTPDNRLGDVVKEQFTSRDGFLSFYSNDLAVWLRRPLGEWDHNELGTLLTAFLRMRMEEKELEDGDMLEYLESAFDEAVAEQIDYAKLHEILGIKEVDS